MRKNPRGVDKNFDKEVPKAYYSQSLLGHYEKESFQDYVQIEVDIFKELLKSDKEFFELMKYILQKKDIPIKLITLKDDDIIDHDFFQEIRMSDDIRSLINETLITLIKDGSHKYLKKLFDKREHLKGKLILSNTRLSMVIARKYTKYCTSFSFGDLVQEGTIGLLKAIDKFDPERGYKFSTYAGWWIKHSIQRSLTDLDPLIRFPVRVYEAILSVNKIETSYMTNYGIADDDKIIEVAKESGLKLNEIQSAIKFRKPRFLYIDAPITDDESTVHGLIPDTSPNSFDVYNDKVNREYAEFLFKFLTPREAKVLRYRFGFINGEELTLKEIGDDLEVSRERIRQIESVALHKLKTKFGRHLKELRSVA